MRSTFFKKRHRDCLLYPTDQLKQLWDLLVGVLVLISALTIPVLLALEVESDETSSSA
jgi:hypothetical protein